MKRSLSLLLLTATLAAQAPLRVVSQKQTDYMFCVLSPDGKDVAFVNGAYEVMVFNLASGQKKRVSKSQPGILDRSLVFSWDGKYIYYLFPDSAKPWIRILYRVSAAGNGEIQKITYDVNMPPAFSSDGKWLAFVRNDNLLFIAPVEGQRERKITTLPHAPSRIFWTADGQSLFASSPVVASGRFSGKWKLQKIAADSGKTEDIVTWQGGWASASTVSPAAGDGVLVFKNTAPANQTARGQIWHYQLSTRTWTQLTDHPNGFMSLIGVSSDGATVAAWSHPTGFWEGMWNVVGLQAPVMPTFEIVLLQ